VATDQQPFYDALNSLILPPKSPQAAPQGIADGPYNGVMPEGEQFTTFVKNGYFDEFLVVYYPNFVTQLRTDLVNGLYDGWVTYRLSDSRIKQKVLFRQGVVQEAIVYSQAGNPEYHFWFTNEQPTSGMRYDSNGNVVESMF
jgi:antitoxin component YwqK of YwqJK toxin-antitoxin module